MKEIVFLKWDSAFFNKTVGKLEVSDADLNLKDLNLKNYDLVYVFSDTPLSNTWQEHLIEERLTFALSLDQHQGKEYADAVNLSSSKYLPSLIPLCLEAGHQSRFKRDPLLKDSFTNMYEKWAEKCLNQDTYGFFDYGKLVGFVSFKDNVFDLMAVNSEYRSISVASNLFKHACFVLQNKGYRNVVVTTQASNESGIGFFKKQGFKLQKKEFIYHLHLD
jgi:dTDP-4-amino-4,6-dideoxy-D-galactose acyltransferase